MRQQKSLRTVDIGKCLSLAYTLTEMKGYDDDDDDDGADDDDDDAAAVADADDDEDDELMLLVEKAYNYICF